MIRKLIFGDSHLSSKQPINRLDDIVAVNESKMERLTHIYHQNKCSGTICIGDLFNTPNPDSTVVKLLAKFINNTGLFELIPGNHDIPAGGNIYSFNKTILSAIMEIAPNFVFFGSPQIIEEVELIPIHYTRDFGNYFLFTSAKKETIVAFAHLLIGKTGGRFVAPQDIISNAELFITAHVHEQMNIISGKTRFVTFGPIIRRRITEKDHIPNVGILEIEGKHVSLRTVKLNAPEAKFRVFPKKEENIALKDIERIVEEAFKINEDLSINELIKSAAKQSGITDEKVINYIHEVIGR